MVASQTNWVSVFSLKKALVVRYKFGSSPTISKATLSRKLVKLDSQIDNQNVKHEYGFYRGSIGNGKKIMQDPFIDTQLFLSARNNEEFWEKIRRVYKKGIG